jgi:hypothetical protein
MRVGTPFGEVVLESGSLLVAWEPDGTDAGSWTYHLLLAADARCAARREPYALQGSASGRLTIRESIVPTGLSVQADGPAVVLPAGRSVAVTHRFQVVHLGSLKSAAGTIEMTVRLDVGSRVPVVSVVSFAEA